MKKRFSISTMLALMLLVAAATFTITYTEVRNQLNAQLIVSAEQQSELKKYIRVKDYIEEYYIGEYSEDEALDGSINGLMNSLGDQWSSYLDKTEYAAYREVLRDTYTGIGLAAEFDAEQGTLVVSEVYQGSTAEKAGIKPLDRIVTVDEKPVAELGSESALTAIQGEPGTIVALGIQDADGKVNTVEVTRADVSQELIKSEILNNNIGYVRIASFDTGASADFKDSVSLLQGAGVQGLILDVRMNPGGSTQEMANMLDALLGQCDVFVTVDKAGNREIKTSDASSIDLPVLVIVNQYTFSTAEYFAAVLQEYGKAEVVGVRTTGKSYEQVPIDLEDGTAILLSTKEYLTPAGKSLRDTGVIPDYPALMTEEEIKNFSQLPHEDDVPLQNAIAVMTQKIEALQAESEPAE